MRSKVFIWFYFIITIACSLRAGQLYWSSTKELRATKGSFWPFSHKKNLEQETKLQQSEFQQNITQQTHILNDKPDNLFYFTQISDLHISKYRAKGHTLHFLHFIRSILPIIKPEFIVVTGDLTDAKDRKRITSQQYIEEWKVYKSAIEQQSWTNTTWYDMRGNHDCFDLPSWQSRVNFYRQYGQRSNEVEQGKGIYSWKHSQPYGEYQFVAIDACPKRGPSRPFNFFGYLTSSTMDRLSHVLMKPSNHTFVFSHYPTTTMVFGVSNHGHTFRDLAKYYSVYFCGHLHRLIAGLGDVLQSYDPMTQTLELELGDMKDHGMYRIVAVDHDIISFVDARLPQAPSTQPKSSSLIPLKEDGSIEWPDAKSEVAPVILITNPKDARFILDTKEPLSRIQSSSHIRFLVFTNQSPGQLTIQIKIDGKIINGDDDDNNNKSILTQYVGNEKNPLWVHPWHPLDYQSGSHVLSIQVKTSSGLIGESTIFFRIDGKRLEIDGGAGEWIISSHMATLLQSITLLSIIVMLFVLLISRVYDQSTSRRLLARIHLLDQQGPSMSRYHVLKRQILVWTLQCLQLPYSQPSVWYGSFIFILSLITLPWFRAEFIPSGETPNERFGTFYMFGMVFGDEWVPIADTWMFAAEIVVLNVLVFFFLFLLHSIPSKLFICPGIKSMNATSSEMNYLYQKRFIIDSAWFKGIELLYWLWRVSEVIALASFYGGIWPTLIQNVLTFWLLFVGVTLSSLCVSSSSLSSSSTILNYHQRRLSWMTDSLEGCDLCSKHYDHKNTIIKSSSTLSSSIIMDNQTEEDSHVVELDYKFSSSSSSGSSASSTPFNRSPRAKSRKRNQKK
ncbi:unnamed protein product [Cunninghamella blakesleeana]